MAVSVPISGLTALAVAPATNDLLALVDVSDLTQAATGTTKSITVALAFTTPTFTTSATVTGGTVTVSTPVLSATQTWNAGGVTFTGIKLNVTDTASAAASKLIDLQVGGASKFAVDKAGGITGVTLVLSSTLNATAATFSGLLTGQAGLTVSAGTSALQAITGTTLVLTGAGTFADGSGWKATTADVGIFVSSGKLALGKYSSFVGLTVDTGGAVVGTSTVTATRLIGGTDVGSSTAYSVLGDATAVDALGFNGTILTLDSRKATAVASGDQLSAHILGKQTAATTGSLQGLETWIWASHTSGTVAKLIGLIGNCQVSGVGGTTTQITCVTGGAIVSGGTATTVESGKFGGSTVTGASSAITTTVGVRILATTVAASGTLTNQYGLKIDAQDSAATLNWTIACASSATSGGVYFRDTALATTATLGDLFVPSCAGTPTGVPANIPTGQIAMRFDTTGVKLWFYTGGSWKGVVVA